jgi:hypothetical protein
MHARSGAFQLSTDKLDEAIESFESDLLPRYREASGYKGFTLMADRESGKVLGISFWESEEDRKASDELGQEAREAVQEAGDGQSDVVRENWEVVLDDMV